MIEIVKTGAEKVGGVVSLANGLGIKHTSLHNWTRVPAERVLEFERLTGISRYDVRPDVYGPKPKQEKQVNALT
ncbi:YdaS family helix-turn-helix protein (plasmid) [Agrobacterium rosae]|uniref:YdaS family helix-turn-helix protein n=1 Tax=Agrobacterium rosae TaxID=1972867 RepID=A0ABU4W7P1_9HYPH|nr:YdaS family helix-turn-helix protein [Agrobacterium rosae]MDX8332863.1 YdaS family helix-turn-helix protein [Agrobacterium rosae]